MSQKTIRPYFLKMSLCLICFLAAASIVWAQDKPSSAAPQSDAKKAFDMLKTLSGSWQGAIMGNPISITIRSVSSGTTILHEATAGDGKVPDHEITMFYVEGERLFAIHYCDAGNRSRMEGKLSPDGKSIEFSLLDVAGGTERGFIKRMMFTIIDANKHGIEGTFVMPGGKPIELRGEFQRTNISLYKVNKKTFNGGAMLSRLLSAEEMIEEHYGFKPTGVDLRLSQMIGRVADYQYKNCFAILGAKNPRLLSKLFRSKPV